MEDGCSADIRKHVNAPVLILPAEKTKIGETHLWDLRALVNLTLPDGLRRVGNFWFEGSGVQSVTIPASVTGIGIEAFFRCKKLKKVIFAENGALETLEQRCFQETGLTELKIPESLRKIQSGAFAKCKSLKKVALNAGMHILADDTFAKTKFEGLRLPDAGTPGQ